MGPLRRVSDDDKDGCGPCFLASTRRRRDRRNGELGREQLTGYAADAVCAESLPYVAPLASKLVAYGTCLKRQRQNVAKDPTGQR